MIKVKISNDCITVSGHANFSGKGSDIVCASVSTAVTMCINQLEIFDELASINYELREGYLELHVVKKTDVVEKVIKNLLYTLSDLESLYPKYIAISENL
jgi:hypothetical protein